MNLFQAIWARFFPAYRELRRLLAQGEIGDARMVRSEFGLSVLPLPRLELKELGGGALLDIGLYPLQFTSMVYGGERPVSIKTEGVILPTGNEPPHPKKNHSNCETRFFFKCECYFQEWMRPWWSRSSIPTTGWPCLPAPLACSSTTMPLWWAPRG